MFGGDRLLASFAGGAPGIAAGGGAGGPALAGAVTAGFDDLDFSICTAVEAASAAANNDCASLVDAATSGELALRAATGGLAGLALAAAGGAGPAIGVAGLGGAPTGAESIVPERTLPNFVFPPGVAPPPDLAPSVFGEVVA
ncbi:MAG TPA: hypothetical protein VKU82_07780 [Planctomycetaceae bacterium]|nr:hypothetical protein [Planctomycetaceae bacterium]